MVGVDAGVDAWVSLLQWEAEYETSAGFSNLYRLRHGDGVRFAELLARLSE